MYSSINELKNSNISSIVFNDKFDSKKVINSILKNSIIKFGIFRTQLG